MTDLQIQIKIAEILGWKPDDDGAGLNTWEASRVGNKLYGLKPRFNDSGKLVSYTVDCVVPNFPEDLNACREFEKTLTQSKKSFYDEEMGDMAERLDICVWELDARQRCEAFLRVHYEWKE